MSRSGKRQKSIKWKKSKQRSERKRRTLPVWRSSKCAIANYYRILILSALLIYMVCGSTGRQSIDKGKNVMIGLIGTKISQPNNWGGGYTGILCRLRGSLLWCCTFVCLSSYWYSSASMLKHGGPAADSSLLIDCHEDVRVPNDGEIAAEGGGQNGSIYCRARRASARSHPVSLRIFISDWR